MRRSRFTETQIVSILKEAEAGETVKEILRCSPLLGSMVGPANTSRTGTA